MKQKLVLCSILLMLSFANVTAAKNLPFKNLVETANWSALPRVASTSVSLDKLPYKNILDAAKWSKLKNGRALTISLKRSAHGAPFQFADDPSALFPVGAGRCNWGCCFKICLGSALPGTTCAMGCGGCVVDGSVFGCAICAACGAVATAAIELCSINCCIKAGGC
ncbi:MAG: hypothetical protein QOG23_2699 [Blastocatellia bacterium]|jgi:hypothetical protein|nr:hypothetical protein [Blastocatellia bacterium]